MCIQGSVHIHLRLPVWLQSRSTRRQNSLRLFKVPVIHVVDHEQVYRVHLCCRLQRNTTLSGQRKNTLKIRCLLLSIDGFPEKRGEEGVQQQSSTLSIGG